MNENWHNYFNSKILKRGLDYYKQGAVENLAYDKNEYLLTAEVYGTEIYNVEISFKDNEIESMYCDCPYALGSDNCKHMAAVLYAFENKKYEFSKTSDAQKISLNKAVEALSEKQAKEILLEYAQKNSDIRDSIILNSCKEISRGQKHNWKREIEKIKFNYSADDEYIDYYHAYDYTFDLIDFLQKKADLLIDNGFLSDAFDLVCMVYEEAFSVDMDDSDGGLCGTELVCEEYWTEIIANADIEAKRYMYKWFQEKTIYGNCNDIIFTSFEEDEFLKQNLLMLNDKIKNYSEDFDYKLEHFISSKCEIMSKLNYPECEITEFRDRYRYLHGVRLQEVNQYIAQKRYAEAIKRINESKIIDKQTGYVSSWSEMLMDLYKSSNNNEAYINELEFYVLNCRQNKLEKIKELKRLTPNKEWEILREKIFASSCSIEIICDLLYEEKLYKRLLAYLIEINSIELLFKYEKRLKELYPEKLQNIILKHSDKLIDCANNRSQYSYAASILSKARTYPNGKKLADETAKAWVERYPRRKAMIDELRKKGFKI